MSNNFDRLQDEAMRYGANAAPGTRFRYLTAEQKQGFDKYMSQKIIQNPSLYQDDPRATKYLNRAKGVIDQQDFDNIRRQEQVEDVDLDNDLYGGFGQSDGDIDWAADNYSPEDDETDAPSQGQPRQEEEPPQEPTESESSPESEGSNPLGEGEGGSPQGEPKVPEDEPAINQPVGTAEKTAEGAVDAGKTAASAGDAAATAGGSLTDAAGAIGGGSEIAGEAVVAGTEGAAVLEILFWVVIIIIVFLLVVFLLSAIFKNGGKKCEGTSASSSSTVVFPVKGTKRAFTGSTKGSNQPRGPETMIIASDAFYEWPVPPVKDSYNTTSNRGSTSKKTDGEPGYMACRGATGGTYCNRGHKGIDIYGSFGTPILAPESGTIVEYGGSDVTNSRESAAGGRGRWLYLKADGGKYYVFMHTEGFSDAVLKGLGLSKQIGETSATKANFKVKAGDTIAYIGNTGGIQNPHLHLGVYTDAAMSNSEDPTSILGGASSDIPTTDASGCPTTNSGNDGTIVSTACSFEKSVRDAGCVDKSECLIEKLYNAVRVKTFTDCWGFAATILKITVDPKVQYGMQAHDAAKEYFDLHPEKYQVIRGITDPKQLKPGDILVRESGGSHVSVFVGDKGCGCPKNVVSASYPTHGPQCSNWYGAMSTAVRLK